MKHEELRTLLNDASEYKATQVAQAESEINEAKQRLQDAEDRLKQWSTADPFKVIEVMDEQRRREASASSEAAYRARLEASHAAALAAALNENKGILAPSASDKSMVFGAAGTLLGALLASYPAAHHFGFSEIGLAATAVIGGIIGSVAGLFVYAQNFIVDESLEQSPFSKFSAHQTVQNTYIKSRDQ